MILILGVLIIAAAVVAVIYRVDVRLTLLLAALALGLMHGIAVAWIDSNLSPLDQITSVTATILSAGLMPIVRMFFGTFANERFVVPICTAMGFAYVLKHTGCDQHLVHLLMKPLLYVRWLLIPGTVVVGFLVNIPVVSQTSTSVALGAVVIPLLMAAKISPPTIGATLLLGCSIGGELLNPGAPELRTTVDESLKAYASLGQTPPEKVTSQLCVRTIFPLDLLALLVAAALFWWLSRRREKANEGSSQGDLKADSSPVGSPAGTEEFRVNLVMALVPIVPLVLLFLTGPPLNIYRVPENWLVGEHERTIRGLFDSRLVGLAMMIGVLVAAAVVWRQALGVSGAFFTGAGYGFANIISLIVIANCFGEGVRLIGLNQVIQQLIRDNPGLLLPLAGVVPLGFAFICGSGMAATQSLFPFFAEPALRVGVNPVLVGAVVSLASAAGRTMSPVAAVTLMCATMTGTNPFDLVKRVAPPLLLGVTVVVMAAMLWG